MAEDRTPLRVVGAQAVSPKVVRVSFDEEGPGHRRAGLHVRSPRLPAVPVQPLDAMSDGAAVRITLDTELTPDVRYRVQVASVEDTKESPVAA